MNAMQATPLDLIEENYCERCVLGGFMRSRCPVTCTVAQAIYRLCQTYDDMVTTLKRQEYED